ncbi:MAG: hypothetical protein ACERKN_15155 [Velocimicrobium sp.]
MIYDKKKLAEDLLEIRITIEPKIECLAVEHATVSEIKKQIFARFLTMNT